MALYLSRILAENGEFKMAIKEFTPTYLSLMSCVLKNTLTGLYDYKSL